MTAWRTCNFRNIVKISIKMVVVLIAGYILSFIAILLELYILSASKLSLNKSEGDRFFQFYFACIVACSLGNFLIGYIRNKTFRFASWVSLLLSPCTLLSVYFLLISGSVEYIFIESWRFFLFSASCVASLSCFLFGRSMDIVFKKFRTGQ
jgi:hypothetical protein